MNDTPETPDDETAEDPIEEQLQNHPETRIDAAWREAQADPENEAATSRFLDAVMTEALLCPVWEQPGSDADGADGSDGAEPEEGQEISPKMVEVDGVDTLPLFDSEERLAAFVDEPTAFIALPGRAYFQMLAGQGAQIAINLNVAPSANVFGPETVEALAQIVSQNEEEVALDPSGPLVVSKPEAPSPLVAALAARLNAFRAQVAEAWLATLSEEDPETPGAPGGARQLVLFLRPAASLDEDQSRSLASEMGQLGASFLEDQPLEVALMTGEEDILKAVRAQGFGLIRAAS